MSPLTYACASNTETICTSVLPMSGSLTCIAISNDVMRANNTFTKAVTLCARVHANLRCGGEHRRSPFNAALTPVSDSLSPALPHVTLMRTAPLAMG
jgi:hypothetical protein